MCRADSSITVVGICLCGGGDVTLTRSGAVEARRAHNPKVIGSSPISAIILNKIILILYKTEDR